MSTKKLTLALGAALLVLFTAGFASAHGPGGGGWWGGRNMMDGPGWGPAAMRGEADDDGPCARWSRSYDTLTPAQQTAAEKLFNEHQGKVREFRQQLYSKESQLQGLLADPKADGKQINTLTNEINTLRSNLFKEQVAFRQAFLKETGVVFQGWGPFGGNRQGLAHGPRGRGCWAW